MIVSLAEAAKLVGKPRQTIYRYASNGKMSVTRSIIDAWRNHYNRVKPHSSLGYQPPVLFEEQVA